MFSYERVRLVGGLVICVRWIWCGSYCWCLAGRWGIVDWGGGEDLGRWDQVWVVLCCVVLCISFVFGFC